MTRQRFTPARRQRGIVMWIALGVLIIMSLAGLAMLRQMGGGLSIAGNVAFKQSATTLADLGTETARAWIMSGTSNLVVSSVADGYVSSWGGNTDPTSFNWTTQAKTLPVDAATGNTVRYIVHRLCETPGIDANAANQRCSSEGGKSTSKGGSDMGGFKTTIKPYFRITTRVDGPRNTVSYTQVITN